jgi:hypothetical protein
MRQYCPIERPVRQTAERLILASLWKSGLQTREICTAVETGVSACRQAAFLSSARLLCSRLSPPAHRRLRQCRHDPLAFLHDARFTQPAIWLAIEA